jgi:hypothetical protein
LAEGTYGCVFKGVACPGTVVGPGGTGVVSKVVEKAASAAEVAIMRHVLTADPTGQYTAKFLNVCDRLPLEVQGNACIRTKFAGAATTMITMEAAGQPLHSYFAEKVRKVGLDQAVVLAVSAFATLVRALAEMHRNGVFHFDLNTGNMLVDSKGVGRLIDFGNADFLSTIVLNGMYDAAATPSYPMYINPFDGLLLTQIKLKAPLAVPSTGTNPMETLRADVQLPRLWDVGAAMRAYSKWYTIDTKEIRETTAQTPTSAYLMVPPLPAPGTTHLRDIYEQNGRHWAVAVQLGLWGAMDVYALAVSFVQSMWDLRRTARLSAATNKLLGDVQQLLNDMTNPCASLRPSAHDAYKTISDLCARHNVPIPAIAAVATHTQAGGFASGFASGLLRWGAGAGAGAGGSSGGGSGSGILGLGFSGGGSGSGLLGLGSSGYGGGGSGSGLLGLGSSGYGGGGGSGGSGYGGGGSGYGGGGSGGSGGSGVGGSGSGLLLWGSDGSGNSFGLESSRILKQAEAVRKAVEEAKLVQELNKLQQEAEAAQKAAAAEAAEAARKAAAAEAARKAEAAEAAEATRKAAEAAEAARKAAQAAAAAEAEDAATRLLIQQMVANDARKLERQQLRQAVLAKKRPRSPSGSPNAIDLTDEVEVVDLTGERESGGGGGSGAARKQKVDVDLTRD